MSADNSYQNNDTPALQASPIGEESSLEKSTRLLEMSGGDARIGIWSLLFGNADITLLSSMLPEY